MIIKRNKLFLTAGIIVLLPLVLIVLVSFLFPVNRIADQVEAELEKATGAKVTVSGAGVSWWPRLGVTLKNISVEGTGAQLASKTGTPNELGPYTLELSEFVVQVAVAPLLKKEILVDAVRILDLQVSAQLKEEPIELEGADLIILDLQISMQALQDAGNQSSGNSVKLPVGELIPEQLVLKFQGTAHSLLVKGLPLKNVDFNGDLDHRILTIEAMGAELGPGLLSGNLEIDYERDSRGWLDFSFKAEEVPAGILLRPWAKELSEKLDTNLNAAARGNCILGEQEVIKQTLTLAGKASSSEGTLWARDWLGDVGPYLGQRQDLADIRFKSLDHRLRIDQGQYVVEKIVIDGLDTHWQGEGFLGLDGTIDLGVLVKLPAGFTPDLGQWSFMADTLRDENGRVNLNLNLTGMAAKPKIGVDLGSMTSPLKGNTGDALKKGLGGLLDKWKSR